MNKTLITFFTVLFCLTSSVGYSQNMICEYTGYSCPEIDFKELVKKDDLFYKKFTDVPFTGKTTGEEQGSLKNGKEEGSWIYYWDNGQFKSKGDFKNGKEDGSWVDYHENGQLSSKGVFKNGKEDGSWVYYYKNGQLFYKGNWKNGKEEGYWVWYNKDGTVITELLTGTYKDGKRISD